MSTLLYQTTYDNLFFELIAWAHPSGEFRAQPNERIRTKCANDSLFAGMCRFFARKTGFPL